MRGVGGHAELLQRDRDRAQVLRPGMSATGRGTSTSVSSNGSLVSRIDPCCSTEPVAVRARSRLAVRARSRSPFGHGACGRAAQLRSPPEVGALLAGEADRARRPSRRDGRSPPPRRDGRARRSGHRPAARRPRGRSPPGRRPRQGDGVGEVGAMEQRLAAGRAPHHLDTEAGARVPVDVIARAGSGRARARAGSTCRGAAPAGAPAATSASSAWSAAICPAAVRTQSTSSRSRQRRGQLSPLRPGCGTPPRPSGPRARPGRRARARRSTRRRTGPG